MGRIKDLATQIRSFLADDFHDADGATAGSRKISPFDAHGQFRNALAPRGGVAFDGTSGARIRCTLTGQDIGTDDFSLEFGLRVPLAIPSSPQGVFYLASSPSTNYVARAFFAEWRTDAGGRIEVDLIGSTTSHNRRCIIGGLVTNFAGKVIRCAIVRSGATLTIYINGVPYVTTEATSGASPPAWSDIVTSNYLVLGNNASGSEVLVGPVYGFSFYNCSLSSAAVQEIYELGGAVPERFKFGSQIDLINGATLNGGFETAGGGGADVFANWAESVSAGSTISDETSDIRSGAHAAKLTIDATPGAARMSQFSILALGKAYRWSMWSHGGSGVNETLSLRDPTTAAIYTNFNQTAAYAEYRAEFVATLGTGIQVCHSGAANKTYFIDDIRLTRIGAVLHLPLDDGLGFQLQDVSTNRLHALMPTTGISHVAPLYGPAHIRTTTNTNGNQQLCGGTVLPATTQILRVRARSQTGTPSVTLGTASGGSQVVASVALSTTWKDLTIALTGGINTAANSLWAGSNSTDVVEWDVTWEPLSY